MGGRVKPRSGGTGPHTQDPAPVPSSPEGSRAASFVLLALGVSGTHACVSAWLPAAAQTRAPGGGGGGEAAPNHPRRGVSPSQGATDVSVRSRTDWECPPDTWVLVPTPMPSPEQHNGRKGPSEPNSPCPSPSCVCTNAEFTLGSAGHAHAWGRQAPWQTGGCDLGAWAPSPRDERCRAWKGRKAQETHETRTRCRALGT